MPENTWIQKLTHLLSREPHSQAQLIDLLRDAEQRHLLDKDALQMMEGVLAISSKKARDAMIPRQQIIFLEGNATPADSLDLIIQSQHSRFPVTGDTKETVIGILLAKDLLHVLVEEKTSQSFIHDFIRPAVFIPESKRLDILLKEFRENHHHMAIVIDEYGAVSGLITIEDVLEEIVGEIEDEYDIEETNQFVQTIDPAVSKVNALTPIADFNRHFDTDFSDENFDTIGGLVLQKFGYLPKRNEKTTLGDFEVTVIRASRRGIQLLQFNKKPATNTDTLEDK